VKVLRKLASLPFLTLLGLVAYKGRGPHLHSQNWSPQIATQETEACTMALNYVMEYFVTHVIGTLKVQIFFFLLCKASFIGMSQKKNTHALN